jgi:hypothetical protein
MNDISKKTLLLIIFVFIGLFATAQVSVKAKVINISTKEAIPNAAISTNGNLLDIYSDTDGWFKLSCFLTDTICVRCTGYKNVFVDASEVTRKKTIEMTPDTILVGEVTVLAENAYYMLLQARDSTRKYQLKSFQGVCSRQDRLFLNNDVKRESTAEIIFNVENAGSEYDKIDYWLENVDTRSFIKISEQPYLAYPNTIPLNLFFLKRPSKEELSEIKCTVASNPGKQMVIKVIRAKPTKNLVNQATYYINKQNCIIEGIEYRGDFNRSPVKQSNRYHYQTNIRLAYTMIGDSCMLNNFIYELVFSHKDIDPQKLWRYLVTMNISKVNKPLLPVKGEKLRRLDYLLYKNNYRK